VEDILGDLLHSRYDDPASASEPRLKNWGCPSSLHPSPSFICSPPFSILGIHPVKGAYEKAEPGRQTVSVHSEVKNRPLMSADSSVYGHTNTLESQLQVTR